MSRLAPPIPVSLRRSGAVFVGEQRSPVSRDRGAKIVGNRWSETEALRETESVNNNISYAMYCMSFVCYEGSKEWRCEECLRGAEAVSNRHLPVQQFWHKGNSRKVELGKVKFITNEEVVTLASGKRSIGRGNPSSFGHRSDFANAKRPALSWKTAAPTLPSSKAVKVPLSPKKGPVYAGVGVSPSEHTMPSISVVSKEKGNETAAQVRKMKTAESKDSLHADDGRIRMVDKHTENKTPLKPQHDRLFKEEPANASLTIKEGRDLHKKRDANVLRVNDSENKTPLKPQHDRLFKEEPANASLTIKVGRDLHKKRDVNVLPVNDSGKAVRSIPRCSQILSQQTLLPLKLVISSDEKYHHALEACWRGSFEVLDLVTQFHGTVHAHFPCQVSPKVYDISKHLPGVLLFKMLSRETVWPKIFKLDPPTKNDVALYFMCEVERHKENYAHFIQHIGSHDYALQSCVADVELLLFTSAQLQIDSHNIGGDVYLWGVFRHLKQKKANHAEEKAVSCRPSTPTPHLPHSRSKTPLNVTSMEVDMPQGSSLEREVDMEIDMLGGYPIGRTDVPIKLEDAPSRFSKPIQRPIKLEDSPSQFSKPIQRPAVRFGVKKSVNSHFLGPPPGFPIPAYNRSVRSPPGKPTKDFASSNSTRN